MVIESFATHIAGLISKKRHIKLLFFAEWFGRSYVHTKVLSLNHN